jgi:FkbM family methyltransferase
MKKIDLLTKAYSLVQRTGFLRTRSGKRLFVSAYYLYKRYIEDSFFALTRRHPDLFRGGHIFDVGANVGYCSTVFAAVLTAGCRVFAFEPETSNFAMLEEAVASHGLADRVVPVHAAVGDAEREVELWLNEHHHADHRILTECFRDSLRPDGRASVTIPAVSIDSFVEANQITNAVSFIKIDVQGYEFAVCRGLERTLARWPHCTVALEYMPDALTTLGFATEDLERWFEQQGLNVYTLQQNGRLLAGKPAAFAGRGYADLVLSRRLLKTG